ncbi:hypothetical protein HaLaN_27812, partial [Haematococcus lacustris]
MADDLLQHHSERESCIACYKANATVRHAACIHNVWTHATCCGCLETDVPIATATAGCYTVRPVREGLCHLCRAGTLEEWGSILAFCIGLAVLQHTIVDCMVCYPPAGHLCCVSLADAMDHGGMIITP